LKLSVAVLSSHSEIFANLPDNCDALIKNATVVAHHIVTERPEMLNVIFHQFVKVHYLACEKDFNRPTPFELWPLTAMLSDLIIDGKEVY